MYMSMRSRKKKKLIRGANNGTPQMPDSKERSYITIAVHQR